VTETEEVLTVRATWTLHSLIKLKPLWKVCAHVWVSDWCAACRFITHGLHSQYKSAVSVMRAQVKRKAIR